MSSAGSPGSGRRDSVQVRRGRLLERIATQRATFARAMAPVESALATTDRVVERVRGGIATVRAHPGIAVVAAAALFILKTRRTLRWARRGLIAWRAWCVLREKLPLALFRARP